MDGAFFGGFVQKLIERRQSGLGLDGFLSGQKLTQRFSRILNPLFNLVISRRALFGLSLRLYRGMSMGHRCRNLGSVAKEISLHL